MKKNCSACGTNDEHRLYMELKHSEKSTILCHHCFKDFDKGFKYVHNQKNHQENTIDFSSLTPKEIYQQLNKRVIGQEAAKKILSTAIVQHYRKINKPHFNKSNILMLGPSGSGKTELARVISKFLKVPFLLADASNLTASGYIGGSADDIIRDLYITSEFNVENAEKAIVFIDEVDKLAQFGSSGNGGDNNRVKSSDVQRELLKILEGKTVSLKFPEGDQVKVVNIKTDNILFICAGAFVDMDKIIRKRLKMVKSIGLGNQDNDIKVDIDFFLDKLITEDLQNYGFIPELIGRLPVRTYTKQLQKKDLLSILTEPEESIIKEYTDLFSLDNVNIKFSKKYLNQVVEQAILEKTGARGLRTILQKDIDRYYFDLEKYKGKNIKL